MPKFVYLNLRSEGDCWKFLEYTLYINKNLDWFPVASAPWRYSTMLLKCHHWLIYNIKFRAIYLYLPSFEDYDVFHGLYLIYIWYNKLLPVIVLFFIMKAHGIMNINSIILPCENMKQCWQIGKFSSFWGILSL